VKIHEYQGKAVLAGFGVPVPKGKVAYTSAEAVEAGRELGFPVVVKAQIHAGGRGKGGGVKFARSAEDCETLAKAMLGMKLVTHQTGPEGRIVRRLLIEQGMDLEGSKEMYLAIVVDRASGSPVFMASAQGGMDIEEVAAKDPKAILKEVVNPAVGFSALVGLATHTFFDGVSIASAFLVSAPFGVLVFCAVFLHKLPEGFTVASIALASGRGPRGALTASLILAASTLAGVVGMNRFAGAVAYALPISTGAASSTARRSRSHAPR